MGSAIDKLVGATTTATPKAPSLQAPSKQSAIDRLISGSVAQKQATVQPLPPKLVSNSPFNPNTPGHDEFMTQTAQRMPSQSLFKNFLTSVPGAVKTAASTLKPSEVSKNLQLPTVVNKATEAVFPRTPQTSVLRNLPSSIAENLPFGVGEAVKQAQDMSGPELDQLKNISAKEYGKFTVQGTGNVAKGFIQAPVRIAAQVKQSFGGNSDINLPILGKTESYSGEVQRDIANGTPAWLAVAKQVPNIIFDTLFVAGVAEKAVKPREATILTGNKKAPLQTNELGSPEQSVRNFRSYEPAKPRYVPIENSGPGAEVHSALDGNPKYNPKLPTFLKVEPTPEGFKGSIVQIKPSLLNAGLSKLFGSNGEVLNPKIIGNSEIVLQGGEVNGQNLVNILDKSVAPKTTPVIPGSLPLPPGQQPVSEVDRLVNPEASAVADKQFANNYLTTNPEKVVTDYTKIVQNKYGSSNVVSADHAKEAIPGYNGTNSDEYQPAASKFATAYYDKLLQEQKGKANNTVLIFAGGTGAGKTSALKSLGEATSQYSIVYDTNAASVEAASSKIDKALADGYKVRVLYVLRDPALAYEQGVIPRTAEEGRVVTIDTHLKTHKGSYETIPQLQAKYGDKIQLEVADNTGAPGQAKIVPVDKMPKIDHANNIKERLYGQLQAARQQNRLTEQQFRKAAGELGPTVRGQSEQERQSGRRAQSQKGLTNPKKVKPTELPTPKKRATLVAPKGTVKTPIKPDWAKSDDLTPGIIEQLKNAEPGKRIGLNYGKDAETIAWKSTFPDWIPSDLRLSSIIKPVAEHLANGTLPTSKKQIELYNYIAEMIGAEDLAHQEETKALQPVLDGITNIDEVNKLINEAVADEQAILQESGYEQIPIQKVSESANKNQVVETKESGFGKQKQGNESLASKGGQPIGTFEQMPDNVPETAMPAKGTAQFKLFERVEQFIKKYAERMGEGYLPRNARGVYYKDSKNIFIDGLNSVSVAAHETTHYIDHKYEIIKEIKDIKDKQAEVKKQLTNLYVQYYPGGRVTHKLELRLREGYATLVQKYAETPKTIEAEYPYLVSSFLKPGGKYFKPVVGEMIQDLRTLITDYQGLSSLDKIGSMVGNGDFNVNKKSFLSLWETIRTVIADDIYPAEVLDTRVGFANSKKSVSLMLRGARNYTASVFQHNLDGKNGLWIFDKSGEIVRVSKNNIGNLIQDLAKKKIVDEFAYYLVARDGYFEYQRLDEMKKALDEITDQESKEYQTKLAEYEDQKKRVENNPFTRQELTNAYEENKTRFPDEEQMFDEMTRQGELQALHNAQILSPESFKEFSDRKGYASRKRIALYNEILGDELGGAASQLKVGKTRISSLLRRKGSQRAIQNPLYSLIRDHGEIMTKTAKQHVYNRALESWAPNFPDLFQTQKYSMGMEKDNHYIIARKDYKKTPILVDNLVKNILDNILSPSNLNFFESALRVAAQVKTIGTTGLYAPFAAVNFLRDNITAPIFSANKYIPIYDAIKELVKILDPTNPEHMFAKEWFTLGGEKYTLVSMDSDPSQVLKKIAREKTGILAAIGDFRTSAIEKVVPTKFGKAVVSEATENFGLGALSMPAKYSEIMTRLTEYVKARQSGKDVWTAMEDSQRVSGPFSHIGAWQRLGKPKSHGSTWIKSIPFANAILEVFDQFLRTMATKGGRKRYSFVAVAIMAAMISTLYYTKKKSTEEQRQALKDLSPEMLARYIFVPKPSGEDFYRIPVPTEAAMPAVLMNMFLIDKWFGPDYSLGEYADAGTSFLPDQLNPESYISAPKAIAAFMPQVFSMFFQSATKTKVFPAILPVESDRMKQLPSEDRYNEGSSAFAKWLGQTELAKKLNLSPLMTDFLLTGWVGRASGIATGQQQAYDPSSQFLQPYYWESGRTMENYWTWQEYINQETTALKQLHKAPDKRAFENRGLVIQIQKLMPVYSKIFKSGDIENANKLRMQILEMASKLPKFSEE